jgi:hypothetical protein
LQGADLVASGADLVGAGAVAQSGAGRGAQDNGDNSADHRPHDETGATTRSGSDQLGGDTQDAGGPYRDGTAGVQGAGALAGPAPPPAPGGRSWTASPASNGRVTLSASGTRRRSSPPGQSQFSPREPGSPLANSHGVLTRRSVIKDTVAGSST